MFDLDRLASAADVSNEVDGPEAMLAREERRALGAYFTPQALVELVVDEVLKVVCAEGARLDGLRILDPACGDGRFLVEASRWLQRRAGLSREQAEIRLVGIERDPRFAAIARSQLSAAKILCADSLLTAREVGTVDAVIGNPPYLRAIERERLSGRYEATSHGEWDLYSAFIEQAFEWVAKRGEVGLVVPSRWMTSQAATRLRAKLANERALRGVVDFGELQLFRSATTYVSLAFISGKPQSVCAVARYRGGGWSKGAVSCDRLGAEPWNLAVGSERRALERMERCSGGRCLGEQALIAKGAGTNCDRVFVVEPIEERDTVVVVRSRVVDEPIELERELVRRCYRGRDVPALHGEKPEVLALIPYDDDGRLLEPRRLADAYPAAWRYLSHSRELLERREQGRWRGDRFYCFGRPQNMMRLLGTSVRVVVPDVARGGRAVVDRAGTFVLDSAYAVFPHRSRHAAALAAILASPVATFWLSSRGVLVRGGYVRMKTRYLEQFPLPNLEELSAKIDARPGRWFELVLGAYGFSSDELPN